jgi:DNA-binding transcriptional MerR regulator
MPLVPLESPDAPARMRIGELAARAEVSHRTVHYYERLGLLRPSERHGKGYRYYDAESLARLRKIRQLQELGLNLDEIGEVLDLYFSDPTGVRGKRRVREILAGHLAEARRKRAELDRFCTDLEAGLARLDRLIADAEAAG